MLKAIQILFLLSFGALVYAADIPQEFRYFANFGGLNTKESPVLIADNESPDCKNVYFTTKGAIIKRNGYDDLNDTAMTGTDQVTSLYQYTKDSGTSYFISSSSNTVYKMDSLDGTWDDITDTSVTADANWKFITWKDTLLGVNNTDKPIKWTGSGNWSYMGVPTNLTKARDIVTYRNYAILLNVTVSGTAFPSRFYYSNLNILDTYTSTDFVDVNPSDGDVIVGAIVFGSDMYIFKRFSIYEVRYTGDSVSPFTVRKTNSEVGAESTNCILVSHVGNNEAILFNSLDGIYAFDGETSLKISEKIDPTYNALAKDKLSVMSAIEYKKLNQVWFSCSTSTTNDLILVYHYDLNAWSRYSGINAAMLGRYINSGTEKIYHGDYSGKVYTDDTGSTDFGSAINAYWDSKWFDFGSIGLKKNVPNVILVTDDSGNYDLTLGYSYDFGPQDEHTISVNMLGSSSLWDSATWDSSTWGGQQYLVHRKNLSTDYGRFFNIKFTNSNASQPFSLYGYALLVQPKGQF